MRRWRFWTWRFAGDGDEKGRSGLIVRICKRQRHAFEQAATFSPSRKRRALEGYGVDIVRIIA
jgi:hypothetical protein